MYFLFTFDHCYPSGGAYDSGGVFETIEQAEAAYMEDVEQNQYAGGAAHIAVIDGANLKIIREGWRTSWRDGSGRHVTQWKEKAE